MRGEAGEPSQAAGKSGATRTGEVEEQPDQPCDRASLGHLDLLVVEQQRVGAEGEGGAALGGKPGGALAIRSLAPSTDGWPPGYMRRIRRNASMSLSMRITAAARSAGGTLELPYKFTERAGGEVDDGFER